MMSNLKCAQIFNWHVKPVGKKGCPICQCPHIRAGVRHRMRMEDGKWEKIIKVCFGTDTSIEEVK